MMLTMMITMMKMGKIPLKSDDNDDDNNDVNKDDNRKKYLSKAMTTMRKVWQVRTTVVRGWRRRGKRKAYLKKSGYIFLYVFHFFGFHSTFSIF